MLSVRAWHAVPLPQQGIFLFKFLRMLSSQLTSERFKEGISGDFYLIASIHIFQVIFTRLDFVIAQDQDELRLHFISFAHLAFHAA
jgi:hypothetical protein